MVRVLGRDAELAAIDEFVSGVRDRSGPHRVALLTGEAGVGKTVLLDLGRAHASARGLTVLTARPVESETRMGFAALVDLFADVGEARLAALPAPQQHALRVALLRTDAGDEPADARSVATATLGILRALSTDTAVLIAVDDLAWLDASTRRVLSFALRRTGAEPIGLLATVRTEHGELPALATDAVEPGRLRRITPQPLTVGAIRELVAERLGFAPTHRLLVRIHETSGGNPFFALELARVLAAGPLPGPRDALPVPGSLRRLVHGRVARLPAGVRDVLLNAALAPGCRAELVLAATIRPETARAHLEAAGHAGVVEAAGNGIAFAHPLLRSVVVEDASAARVRAAHARLAAVIDEPTARARHLALAADGADAAVAGALDEAARVLHSRGASDGAAELADLAIVLTPPEDTDYARDRAMAAAAYHFDSGDPARARALVEAVVAREEPGVRRAPLLFALAKYARYAGEPLAGWEHMLTQALAESDENDVTLRMALHMALGVAAFNGGDMSTAPAHISGFLEHAARFDGQFSNPQVAAGVCYVQFMRGDGLDQELVAKALVEPRDRRLSVEESPTYTIAVALAHSNDTARARALLVDDIADAEARGDEVSLPILLWLLIVIETWHGNWDRADALATRGQQLSQLADNPFGMAVIAGARGLLRVAQGRVDEARADARTAQELGAAIGLSLPVELGAETSGLLDLSLGDAAAARAATNALAERSLEWRITDPGTTRILAHHIEACVRLGELGRARRLLSNYADRLTFAAPSLSHVNEARCRALLLAAEGDTAAALAAIDDAVSGAERVGLPFEQARALVAAAEIQRRARQRKRAQESLTVAEALFAGLGATRWAEHCAQELVRLGGRGPRPGGDAPGELTEAEARVAALAAAGRTTRQIAGDLFTSERTVEAHLHRVYQKLGVRSRVELSRHLAQPDQDAAEPT